MSSRNEGPFHGRIYHEVEISGSGLVSRWDYVEKDSGIAEVSIQIKATRVAS